MTEEVKEKAPKKVKEKKPPFYVRKGKSLTTKKGVIGPGGEIKPEYLAGGKDTLDKLIEKGYIGKG